MKVEIVVPFVAEIGGVSYHGRKGEVLELPEGADWLTAGWVVPVRETEQETAVLESEETAVKPRAKRRKLEKKDATKSGDASNN